MGVIIRQGFKASVSNYIGMIIGFFSMFILFPLFFEPESLGAVRLFIELGTVLSTFALMGTHYSINRFFPFFRTQDQNHNGFFFWVLVIPFIGYVLLMLIFATAGKSFFLFINPQALQYEELFPMLLVLIFITLYQLVTEVTSANYGRTAVPNFMREIVMRTLIVISGSLYYFKLVTFDQSIWLIVLSYFIALCGNIWFLGKLTKINLRPDFGFIKRNKHIKKDAIGFSAIIFFSGIASMVVPKMDFFMISSIKVDLSEVAIYSIGFYLATFIEIPKRAILQVANPVFSALMKEENYAEVEKLNKKNGTNQLLISGILFFLIWLNIDNLYQVMPRGAFFSKGKWVVFYIGISKLIEAVACGNGPVISNSKFYPMIIYSIVTGVVTAILFNVLLIPVFGIVGGAMSTILVMFCANLCNIIVLQYKLRINPFSFQQLLILAVLAVFFLTTLTGKWFTNPFLDGFIRTIVLGTSLVWVVYKLRLSEDFNQLLTSKIPFLK